MVRGTFVLEFQDGLIKGTYLKSLWALPHQPLAATVLRLVKPLVLLSSRLPGGLVICTEAHLSTGLGRGFKDHPSVPFSNTCVYLPFCLIKIHLNMEIKCNGVSKRPS